MLAPIESARLLSKRDGIAKDLLVVVILVSIVLVFLWPSLFLDKTLLPVDFLLHLSPWSYYSDQPPIWNGIPSDAVLNFYPWKLFSLEALKGGTLPLWNPYQMSGTPFVANSQAGLFYPFNLLFLLLPPLRAYALFVAIHLFLAGLFMYAFLRSLSASRLGSLSGGIAFMCSPFLIGWSEHLPHLSVMVWLPLIFILLDRMLERRSIFYAMVVGFVFGVQLLGGMFQFSFFIFLASFLYFIFRVAVILRGQPSLRRGTFYLALISLATVLALSLAAIQLLPSLEISQFIIRAAEKPPTGHFFMPYAMSFSYLITLLEPNFIGSQSDLHPLGSRSIIDAAYVGIFPFLLACVNIFNLKNRNSLFFLLLALLAISLALGSPLYQLLFLFPMLNFFRAPSRFLYLEVFALSALAGLGFDHLVHLVREREKRPGPWTLAILWLTPLTGVSLLVNRVAAGYMNIYPGEAPPWPYAVGQTVILLFLFSASFTVLILFSQRRMSFYMFGGLVLLVTVIDVVGQNLWFFPAIDYDKAYLSTASTKFLQENIGLYRVARYGTGFLESPLPPDTGMIYGLSDTQGKDIFILKDYVDFLNLIEDHQERPLWFWNRLPNFEESKSLSSKLIDLLNVKYVLATEAFEAPGYELVFDGNGRDILIYENKEVLPRTFIVHRVKVILEKEKILAQLKSDSYNPSLIAIISEELPPLEKRVNEGTPLKDDSEAEILDYGLNTISIKAKMESPGFLVLADVYYPGWKVVVDGQERKIYRTDYIFRSVYLEEGEHDIKFLFDPLSFKIGLYLTSSTLLLLGGFFIFLPWSARQVKH
jgi:uncharacterized membrane protein YfhO